MAENFVLGKSQPSATLHQGLWPVMDPSTGVVCMRFDKRRSVTAYNWVTSATIRGEPVTIIFINLCRTDHSKALGLLDYRLPSFQRNLDQVMNGIDLPSIHELYFMVESELRKFATMDLRRAELDRLEDRHQEGYDEVDPDPLRTLKEEDWLPHLQTAMVAIFRSGEVAVAGPGACSVAIVGKDIQITSVEPNMYATLDHVHLGRDEVLVISECNDLAYKLKCAMWKRLDVADLGSTFVVAKFVSDEKIGNFLVREPGRIMCSAIMYKAGDSPFVDPNTGVVCMRRDRDAPVLAHNFMTSAMVGGKPATIIFFSLYRGHHSKAMRLMDYVIPSFKKNLPQVKDAMSDSAVRELYERVTLELRTIDPHPLEGKEWPPHLHTNMVAIFGSGEVVAAGSGSGCSIAIVGDKIDVVSLGLGKHADVIRLQDCLLRDELLVMSECSGDDLAHKLECAVRKRQEMEEADLGTTFVVAKFGGVKP